MVRWKVGVGILGLAGQLHGQVQPPKAQQVRAQGTKIKTGLLEHLASETWLSVIPH